MPATRPRTTFHEQVVDQLGSEICTGKWAPGAELPAEPDLCERFGFSRIVVREAMKSLAAKGMIAVNRRIGTVVQDPTRWNLFDPQVIAWRASNAASDSTMMRDLLELRRIVEPAAVRLASLRATAEERRALRASYHAMARAAAGKGNYVEADLTFHTTILAACGNQFLRQMQEAMSAMLRTSFEIGVKRIGGKALALPLHEALCEAIERGDPDAAEQAAITLIESSAEELQEVLSTYPAHPAATAAKSSNKKKRAT